jgi:hypothetical protein
MKQYETKTQAQTSVFETLEFFLFDCFELGIRIANLLRAFV